MKSRLKSIVCAVAVMFSAGVAFAGPKTLIEMEGTKPKAGLAKSWKKVKDGVYQFDLDLTQEVKTGVKVSPAIVKNDLEAKLGSGGVKVAQEGTAAVKITYKGTEADFLKKIAETKIRGTKVELALESSVSEGSIRAKTLDRGVTEGEVKGIVVASKGELVTLKIRETKFKDIKVNERVKLKTDGSKHKVKDLLFFMPEAKEGDIWTPKADSVK